MNKRTCSAPECNKPHRAKGLCNTHYGQQNPNKYRKVTVQCAWCTGDCEKEAGRSEKYANLYCSIECHGLHRQSLALPKPEKVKADRRMPLRRAYEDGDNAELLEVMKAASTMTDEGCWLWRRVDRGGYPVVVIAKRHMLAHRMTLEASTGKPLGHMQSHHKCAQTSCINPDHLQAVEHVDNRAEMFKRGWYEGRIRELEDALRAVDPMSLALR